MKHVTILAVFQFTRGKNEPLLAKVSELRADFPSGPYYPAAARGRSSLPIRSAPWRNPAPRSDSPWQFPLLPVFFRCELVIGLRCRFSIENFWPHSRQTR